MVQNQTILLMVLDSLGKETVERYISASAKEIKLPNLGRLGLGNILKQGYRRNVGPPSEPDLALEASPCSRSADSVTGHRELMGFIDPASYELFFNGFPREYVAELEKRTGKTVLCNKRLGGMDAIEKYHYEHMETGGLILYASMCDPLIQLAAHEEKIRPSELAMMTKTALDLALEQGVRINRAISRPYIVKDSEFVRTSNRYDAVIPLPKGAETFVDVARDNGIFTVGIGKPAHVVNTFWDHVPDKPDILLPELEGMFINGKKKELNPYSVMAALDELKEAKGRDAPTFIMCNLPDADSLFGHKKQVENCLGSLAAFDGVIPLIEKSMPENSSLIITADHGMMDGGDYGYHNMEPVFVLGKGFGKRISDGVAMPESCSTYALVGYICAQLFGFGDEFLERCNLKDVVF